MTAIKLPEFAVEKGRMLVRDLKPDNYPQRYAIDRDAILVDMDFRAWVRKDAELSSAETAPLDMPQIARTNTGFVLHVNRQNLKPFPRRPKPKDGDDDFFPVVSFASHPY